MFDVKVRDGAARLTRWALGDREVLTPAILHVDTERHRAPEFAEILLARRRPETDLPWVLDRGSRFSPVPVDEDADVTLAPDLPYPPAAGPELRAAGHAENVRQAGGFETLVHVAPGEPGATESDVAVLGAARALLEDPYRFASEIVKLKRAAGPARLVYAPGCGLPHEIALLTYAGVDLVDSAPVLLATRREEWLTPEGPLPMSAVLDDEPCTCPGCLAGDLRLHNLRTQVQEVKRVRAAIRDGTLRELVEQRVRARPNLAAHLRRMDLEQYGWFEEQAPVLRDRVLHATSKESIQRPEVERFRRRLTERYRKPTPTKVLLVLPCSARKPYSESRTHRTLANALAHVANRAVVHEVVLTSPLGAVPRELETLYPAAHYDLPVTGNWDEDEKVMIRDAFTSLLARNRYSDVLVHLEEIEVEIVAPVLGDFLQTAERDPLAPASLENLRRTLEKATEPHPRVSWQEREAADLASLARFQFGEAGDRLLEGCRVRGKPPFRKLLADGGTQIAMTSPTRGYLTLTLAGGRRLFESGAYRVEIEDFRPKGTIFSVGVVAADPEIREGDEVVVHHAGEVRGVGRALAPGREMEAMPRGPAVHVRHKDKEGSA